MTGPSWYLRAHLRLPLGTGQGRGSSAMQLRVDGGLPVGAGGCKGSAEPPDLRPAGKWG